MQKNDLEQYKLPDVPGVYLFTKGRGRGRRVLYVGKATSLRDRVRSYFDDALIETRGPRIVDMVTEADGLLYETTVNVLEALVREAALIRTHQPRANAEGKDDKTFLYVGITKEDIPRVLTVRGKDIGEDKRVAGVLFQEFFGPFPSGRQLKVALGLIRKIFPFFDTPRPVAAAAISSHTRAKLEFDRQIGRAPRVVDRVRYRESLARIALYLRGEVSTLKKTLARSMRQAAVREAFEEAAELRRQLFALDHVQDVALIEDEYRERSSRLRIEAYDTAHLRGTNALGVFVVVDDGAPVKRAYRTFAIRGMYGSLDDDLASLKELLSRRLTHTEWPYPSAFIIDGGTTHKKTIEAFLREVGVSVPVVAVVKDTAHRPREVLGARAAGVSEADAVLANAEAHRFSLARHRAKRLLRRKT